VQNLHWIDSDVQRHELTDTLKSRISVLATVSGQNQSSPVTLTAVSTQGSSGHRQPPDFFAASFARRHRPTGSLNATQEVDKYLADTANTVASLDAYPHIRQMYSALDFRLAQRLQDCFRWEDVCFPLCVHDSAAHILKW